MRTTYVPLAPLTGVALIKDISAIGFPPLYLAVPLHQGLALRKLLLHHEHLLGQLYFKLVGKRLELLGRLLLRGLDAKLPQPLVRLRQLGLLDPHLAVDLVAAGLEGLHRRLRLAYPVVNAYIWHMCSNGRPHFGQAPFLASSWAAAKSAVTFPRSAALP